MISLSVFRKPKSLSLSLSTLNGYGTRKKSAMRESSAPLIALFERVCSCRTARVSRSARDDFDTVAADDEHLDLVFRHLFALEPSDRTSGRKLARSTAAQCVIYSERDESGEPAMRCISRGSIWSAR